MSSKPSDPSETQQQQQQKFTNIDRAEMVASLLVEGDRVKAFEESVRGVKSSAMLQVRRVLGLYLAIKALHGDIVATRFITLWL